MLNSDIMEDNSEGTTEAHNAETTDSTNGDPSRFR